MHTWPFASGMKLLVIIRCVETPRLTYNKDVPEEMTSTLHSKKQLVYRKSFMCPQQLMHLCRQNNMVLRHHVKWSKVDEILGEKRNFH